MSIVESDLLVKTVQTLLPVEKGSISKTKTSGKWMQNELSKRAATCLLIVHEIATPPQHHASFLRIELT